MNHRAALWSIADAGARLSDCVERADIAFVGRDEAEMLWGLPDATSGAGDAFAGGYLAARLAGAGMADRLQAGHDRAAAVLTTTADVVDEEKDAS